LLTTNLYLCRGKFKLGGSTHVLQMLSKHIW
jgi:hypothetical protein